MVRVALASSSRYLGGSALSSSIRRVTVPTPARNFDTLRFLMPCTDPGVLLNVNTPPLTPATRYSDVPKPVAVVAMRIGMLVDG